MKKILGISAFYHDSAAALVVGGEIIAAAQEERFTREKHTAVFPVESVKYVLKEAGLRLDDLDAVVFYDKPFLKFERLLQTYYAFAPKGLLSFIKAIPVWLNEKLFLKRQVYKGLQQVGPYDKQSLKLLFTEHHLSHAASAFYPSGFDQAAVLTIDGVGEWCTASIGKGSGSKLELLRQMDFPHSVGLLYSALTYYLGFEVNGGEYKVMGLAPYANREDERVHQLYQTIRSELMTVHDDGSIWLDQDYFNYSVGLTMAKAKKWEALFGIKQRQPESELTELHCQLALAFQLVIEEVVLRMAKTAKELTGANKLCLAGGVALNCVANGKLKEAGLFDEIFVQPAAGDAGGSLGAALATHYLYFDQHKSGVDGDGMKNGLLGPAFPDFQPTGGSFESYDDDQLLASKVADLLAEGKVVGWFQGRMEFGPRALGNRSILGDPRNAAMQSIINQKIKFRESFRPFAPAVLAERSGEFFEDGGRNPYMTFITPVRPEKRKDVKVDGSIEQQLKTVKSEVPAITHADFTARVQTVDSAAHPKFHQLISAFDQLTGCPMLINTSFNVRGEPIVCTPEDAYKCFMATDMDYLVINNYVYSKQDQL